MAVKIRLQRHGSKGAPVYRLVAADARARRDGRFVEVLGTYNPKATKQDDEFRSFKLDRIDYWLEQGAHPTDTARSLISKVRAATPASSEQAAS